MGKSVTEPTHVLQHLGFIINSTDMTIQITQEKYNNIRHWANTLLKKNNLKIRDVAKVVGILVSCAPGVQYAPLFYKQLDIEKGLALKQNFGNFDSTMRISKVAKTDLAWWTNEALSDKKPISHFNADLIIQTDASSLGWGAKREGMEATGGRWAGEDMFQHINYLELKAAFLGILALCKEISDSHILVQMDKVTAVSYINNMGGTHSLMCNKLAKDIWIWCRSNNIWLSATHIPGITNVEADRASRKFKDSSEWQLDPSVFERITEHWGKPNLDLFASQINFQFKPYISWKPDPDAKTVNAFTFSWHDDFMYIFPPFSLMGQVLKKIREDKGKAIVIAPLWPTQPWWPRLCQLMSEPPLQLRNHKNLLSLPYSPETIHPLWPKLRLIACLLSGTVYNSKGSLLEPRKLY